MVMLKCSNCGLMKPENEFSRNRRIPKWKGKLSTRSRAALYGRTYDCLVCIRKKRLIYRETHPEFVARLNAKRRELFKHPEAQRRQRNAMLKSRYGITIVQYEDLLKEQDGTCAICHSSVNNKRQKYLHVDHNHKTGKIRGILCGRCNHIIGLCDENANILKMIMKYLFRHLQEV